MGVRGEVVPDMNANYFLKVPIQDGRFRTFRHAHVFRVGRSTRYRANLRNTSNKCMQMQYLPNQFSPEAASSGAFKLYSIPNILAACVSQRVAMRMHHLSR